ncbi:hypothetical protein JXC34_01990, partial [Candidatus Woesearchaeota archaeon]|nr:hypothetical protein [Candidatus Woesearchaeota archaeon]
MIMEDVEKQMNEIREKNIPSLVEVKKYVRYAMNVLKNDPDALVEELSHWKLEDVEKAIKDVERENMKPKPKRYY